MKANTTPVKIPQKHKEPISPEKREVIKRDGSTVSWTPSKITRAISLAFYSVRNQDAPNPVRDHAAKRYGLGSGDFLKVMEITRRVEKMIELYYLKARVPTIEDIQDTVEKAIAAEGEWDVARAYISYRQHKAELRIKRYSENGLEDYIAVSKYARFRPDLKRRETFAEAVDRVCDMHLKRFADHADKNNLREALESLEAQGIVDPKIALVLSRYLKGAHLSKIIRDAFEVVKTKRVLPSMRSMQFGGTAITSTHARMFNCAFSAIDRLEFFREYFYLLLAGVGCGFSVQKHHMDRLPAFPLRLPDIDLPVEHYVIEDTIEGWANSIDKLLRSFLEGVTVEFNFSKIRPRGAPLKTSGGRAPGHLPLKHALQKIEAILRGVCGRRLKPIEAYDICMFIARSVLSGGVRRSATLCLFSEDDMEMMSAKTGNWFELHPQRSVSNNSAVIHREKATRETFTALFEKQKEFGEPGFYFTHDLDYGCNPCCETGLNPVIKGVLSDDKVLRLRELGYAGELDKEVRLSGWQMCNLSTINAASVKNENDFYEACYYATVIGTLQASYTHIPYLGPVSEFINESESLLGVSICGILDNPDFFLNPKVLEKGASICKGANALIADLIGINRAARLTCVKPEGTVSLLLGTGSGIHPHHAKRYFRRVQANRKDPVFQYFKAKNPHLVEASVYQPETDDTITFPVQAPEHAILRNDITARQFLEYVRLVQVHWVRAGNANPASAPNLDHNVSNTCQVKEDEWEGVEKFIWENRNCFTGVALLSYQGDKLYPQAPREEVTTEEDILKWNRLKYVPVDYTALTEDSDETGLEESGACVGDTCEF